MVDVERCRPGERMVLANEGVRHYCGLFGVWGHPQAAALTHLGLYAQQHRGQESAGICTADGRRLHRHAAMGLVNDVFTPSVLDGLVGPVAIGHVRYSTTGSSCATNAQPLLFEFAAGRICLGHNGTLTNAVALREEFEARGHIFQTSSDTEVIVHLLAAPEHQAQERPLASVLERVEGAYSLVLLFNDKLIAARDPHGFRPLCLGQLAGGAYVVASETSALDIVDAEYVREVAPGEILTIDEAGLRSEQFGEDVTDGARGGACIFEHVYFADPSSNIFGENVHAARKRMGEALAREAPVDADLVIPVPNCARCAAIGYSGASGLPLGRGFTTSHYAGRSFILPDQAARDLAVKLKLNVIKDAVRGKRLVVVEDSVVRGTTTRGKISALQRAGATEIHLRVASPPLRHPCYYGIDFPDPAKLVARNRSVEEIREYLGVDSLHYLSVEGMLGCVSQPVQSYCTACFTGDYPTRIRRAVDKLALERR